MTRLSFHVFFLGWACSLFIAWDAHAQVVINEIFFDPVGADTGLEWVEIQNTGTGSVDLSAWQLYPDGIGYFTFPQGFTLSPGGFVVIYLRTSGTDSSTALYHSFATSNMGNTSGSVALFSGEPRGKDTIKSFVQWGRAGETWETAASDAGLWPKGTFVDLSNHQEGYSIGRTSATASAWQTFTSPTPGSTNGASSIPSGSSASSATSSASASQPQILEQPMLRAEAGEDRSALVGQDISFLGKAFGFSGQPLEPADFLWNFGDGSTMRGRSVVHQFSYPGSYTVILTISSGEHSASDSFTVKVQKPQVFISEYFPGKSGWIELYNAAGTKIDISGWRLGDGSVTFIFPAGTILGVQSFAVFPYSATNLIFQKSATLTLRGNTPLSTLVFSGNIPSGASVITDNSEGSQLSLKPTPGAENIVPVGASAVPTRKQTLQLPGAESSEQENKRGEATTTVATYEREVSLASAPSPQPAAVAAAGGSNSSRVPWWVWLIAAAAVGFMSGLAVVVLRGRD